MLHDFDKIVLASGGGLFAKNSETTAETALAFGPKPWQIQKLNAATRTGC